MKKKYYVLIGGYGSGKTELSLNLAINSACEKKKTVLVDLDIVNPYFRSAFHKTLLDKHNVRLIASKYTLEASDVPVVTSEVYSAFDQQYETVVFDVGGDPVGATALGQFQRRFRAFMQDDLEVLFVVNTRRPMMQTVDEICEMANKIQTASRMKITGIVNNTNLARESDAALVEEGEMLLRQVSDTLKIPIAYYGMRKDLYKCQDKRWANCRDGKPISLEIYTRLEWLDFVPGQT